MYFEVILDALKDTALLIPLLFLVHLAIEFCQARSFSSLKKNKVLNGSLAPLIGTGVGLFPQCGFSVIAGDMYSKKYIRMGTLIAVFIATSDEAIPIIIGGALTDPSVWLKLAQLVIIKIVMALFAGYVLNFLFRKKELSKTDTAAHGSEYGCCGHAVTGYPKECEKNDEFASEDSCGCGHAHSHAEESESKAKHIWHRYFKHPVVHTLIITAFVFGINLLLGSIIFFVTEEKLAEFMAAGVWWQPVLTGLVGLIPNCAPSVLISEMFASGTLTLGAAAAGLSTSAGLGFAVLFKENKNIKENIAILAGLLLYSIAVGYVITIISEVLFV